MSLSSSETLPQSCDSEPTVVLENEALIQSLADTESPLAAPINININDAVQVSLPKLQWNNYEIAPNKIKVANTGQTVIVSGRWDSDVPSISGGPLDGNYRFSQLHFHWGRTAVDGSEHTVDGYHLPLELHVIHFNDKYDDQDAAQKFPNGVICLVFFYQLKSNVNEFIKPIVDNLHEVVLPDSVVKITPFPLLNLFHKFSDDYFVYWGSTRSATERAPILWIISRTQECIEFHQLKQFNLLLDGRMRRNVSEPSPASPLDGRHLFHANPTHKMAVCTLAIQPPAKYVSQRWLIDRIKFDFSVPGACEQYVNMVREELKEKSRPNGAGAGAPSMQ